MLDTYGLHKIVWDACDERFMTYWWPRPHLRLRVPQPEGRYGSDRPAGTAGRAGPGVLLRHDALTARGRCLRAESAGRSASISARRLSEATARFGRAETRGARTCESMQQVRRATSRLRENSRNHFIEGPSSCRNSANVKKLTLTAATCGINALVTPKGATSTRRGLSPGNFCI